MAYFQTEEHESPQFGHVVVTQFQVEDDHRRRFSFEDVHGFDYVAGVGVFTQYVQTILEKKKFVKTKKQPKTH